MPLTLRDLTSAEAVQAALDEFVQLGQTAFLVKHGFGRSRDYVVKDPKTGAWADSKAIAGVAIGYQFPGSGGLAPADFSGGDATVAPRLKSLGFEVYRIADIVGQDWRAEEVKIIVEDYLSMLAAELSGQSYSKAAHRRLLMAQLPGRSAQAIEFKHANISAVMLELGFPYVRGYKPRSNFQRSRLIDEVARQIAKHGVLDEVAMSAAQQPAVPMVVSDFGKVLAAAPRRETIASERPAPYQPRVQLKRDYLEREARNRSLGLAGEEFALGFERWRLSKLGAGQLAERVEHVSRTQGDGLGFDIRSFDLDGGERYIEVKTTTFGERTPFFVSANEMRFSRDHAPKFSLYRLFDFRVAPRLFELSGRIEEHCNLDPTTYRASFG